MWCNISWCNVILYISCTVLCNAMWYVSNPFMLVTPFFCALQKTRRDKTRWIMMCMQMPVAASCLIRLCRWISRCNNGSAKSGSGVKADHIISVQYSIQIHCVIESRSLLQSYIRYTHTHTSDISEWVHIYKNILCTAWASLSSAWFPELHWSVYASRCDFTKLC